MAMKADAQTLPSNVICLAERRVRVRSTVADAELTADVDAHGLRLLLQLPRPRRVALRQGLLVLGVHDDSGGPGALEVADRLVVLQHPDEIAGDFDAAVVINFFQHIPTARQDEFLIFLHASLGPGAKVFLAANHIKGKFK